MERINKTKDGYYKARIISVKTKNDIILIKLCVYPKELDKNKGYITIKYPNINHKDPVLLDGKKINLIHSNNKWNLVDIDHLWN